MNLLQRTQLPALLAIFIFSYSSVIGQCCDYSLQGIDTYGDGWNGASLDIYVNGDLIQNFIAQDQGSSFVFEVCDGDEIQFEYFSGMYENENSWFLLGGAGNLVINEGPRGLRRGSSSAQYPRLPCRQSCIV